MSDLIDLHIASLVHNLCAHDNDLSVCDQLVHCLEEILVLNAWQSAHAVAFDDHCIIVLTDPGQKFRVHTWNQFQQKDSWIDVDVKCWIGAWAAFFYIVDNLVVADGCKYREINAVKCIKALGLQFLCTGSGNYFAIKYDAYSMCIRAGCKTKRIEQVCFCIGYFHGNWFLGTGDDNRLRRVLNQVGQCRRGVCHGIGAVADHEAVIIVIILLQDLGELQPVLRVHIRAVDV